jgi:1-phosphofructokinase family hexose kinase
MSSKKERKTVVTVTLNPCLDSVFFVDHFRLRDTNRVLRVEQDAGGKGINISRVISKLGGKTIATGFLGGENGNRILNVLNREGTPHRFISVKGDTRMSIFVEDGEGPPTSLSSPGPFVKSCTFESLLQELNKLLKDAAWLTVGGSIPPGLEDDAFYAIIDLARHHGCFVAVDSDGSPMLCALKAAPNLIKPNIAEAERILGRSISSIEDKIDACAELRTQLQETSEPHSQSYEPIVILTDGEYPAVLIHRNEIYIGEPPRVHARSTVGSGDSLIGGYLWAHLEGKTTPEAFQWGLAAGAATAITNGAEICSRSMVLQLLNAVTIEKADCGLVSLK